MIYVINMLIGMKSELAAGEIVGEYEVISITGSLIVKFHGSTWGFSLQRTSLFPLKTMKFQCCFQQKEEEKGPT